ncbi:uncharacterized protein LOC124899516 [Capsicum annuum]|uniref:uncharacterized protein LOC124899516 n=1 Tax=Capsicum annuum TaxID=4072 RepID=UPI001FB14520|nr:uncharacterized protein LOC124899516 [Capsicum annuum]
MGPFVSSYGLKYILVVVYYVSKWVEAVALADNEGKRVLEFLKKNIFSHFGVPRTIISDGESHLCNKVFRAMQAKYGVKQHCVATPYRPQTSGQMEVSNRKIKAILAKTDQKCHKEENWAHLSYWKVATIHLTDCQTTDGPPHSTVKNRKENAFTG